MGGEGTGYGVNEKLEQLGGQASEHPDHQGEEYHEGALADMTLAPVHKFHERRMGFAVVYISLGHTPRPVSTVLTV